MKCKKTIKFKYYSYFIEKYIYIFFLLLNNTIKFHIHWQLIFHTLSLNYYFCLKKMYNTVTIV